MPTRYFTNRLPDYTGSAPQVPRSAALKALQATLDYCLQGKNKPFVYTGAAGVAYTCWHVHRHAAAVSEAVGEAELIESAVQLSRSALKDADRSPLQHYGWALLGGHAGVFATAALCFNAALHYEERRGRLHLASGLREEMNECLRRYEEVAPLALSAQEDEFLYGRAGYVYGGLMLNHHIRADALPASTLLSVARKIVQSGRGLAGVLAASSPGTFPTPLMFQWPPGPDASPYLGAAHGLMGILYVLLHLPDLLQEPGVREDVEAALHYILTLECDAQGIRGQHGHYPTQMGPWRDREPLVHWCHGATGAVFLFCKAHQVLGHAAYLEAAGRSGEAVWGQGLLKKGPGACHGVSGSAYALLALQRATGNAMWLHRGLQFAEFMESEEFRQGARTPDHPRSLWEGWAAAACLWADLLGGADNAGLPFFVLDV